MAETTHITVAETSDGPCGSAQPGTDVSLPVVELLTGRGFVTGKSGSGKSNSASVIAEKLLDNEFGLLIVDIDGEYYGLKEEYEILHVGGDEECDIQVTTEHAEKIASLALEQNVPIILDVSSYLDEGEAEELLTAVARSLFAKAKKQKQPFLLLVEEVHEYIPERGSVGECGKMLIKIGKRGRKHGLGICGISQRPADVKKDFITQCDWLLWHRLTWNNDTKVVQRIIDGEHADAVENLDDGEGFLMTDWAEQVRRVQFHRKKTFDAGATPGLDDFERPELKSVSDDLVSELTEISEEEAERENRIEELREELDKKNSRIAELERELQDARDLQRMADQFVDALVGHVEGAAPGRTERERMRSGPRAPSMPGEQATLEETAEDGDQQTERPGTDLQEAASAVTGGVSETDSGGGEPDAEPAASDDSLLEPTEAQSNGEGVVSDGDGEFPSWTDTDGPSGGVDADTLLGEVRSPPESVDEDWPSDRSQTPREQIESTIRNDAEIMDEDDSEPLVVRECKADIGALPTNTRKMLAFYREFGPATPLDAFFGADGEENRTEAYSHNRELRTAGLVEHVGRGHYDYCLRDRLVEELDDYVDEETIDGYVRDIEQTTDL
ncbi:protein of unknown function DUF87 [Halovenus aranensis]|uniref:Uncharacterized protein n=1 Tax=Halovenus aranensis TaxID=890420 RepID=A0A1G8S4X6_9EURY|nr:DUF87 domain-containing protein [Halovenus aranensis]SDJ24288.1 protein of unknown function DUF87 [Halovenus aranensis]